jgi:hypothetical protein
MDRGEAGRDLKAGEGRSFRKSTTMVNRWGRLARSSLVPIYGWRGWRQSLMGCDNNRGVRRGRRLGMAARARRVDQSVVLYLSRTRGGGVWMETTTRRQLTTAEMAMHVVTCLHVLFHSFLLPVTFRFAQSDLSAVDVGNCAHPHIHPHLGV